MPLWVNLLIVWVLLTIAIAEFDERYAYAAVGWLVGYVIYLQIV